MELKEQRMHFFKVFSVFSIKWEGEGRGGKISMPRNGYTVHFIWGKKALNLLWPPATSESLHLSYCMLSIFILKETESFQITEYPCFFSLDLSAQTIPVLRLWDHQAFLKYSWHCALRFLSPFHMPPPPRDTCVHVPLWRQSSETQVFATAMLSPCS